MIGQTDAILDAEVRQLGMRFKLEDLGPLHHYLGCEVLRHDNGDVTLNQAGFIRKTLQQFDMSKANPVLSPMDSKLESGSLCKSAASPKSEAERLEMEQYPYRALVGKLLYLSHWTRPDIAFPVSVLSKVLDCPGKAHWRAGMRILRYLKGAMDKGIRYSHDAGIVISDDLIEKNHILGFIKREEINTDVANSPNVTVGYTDASWGDDKDSGRSTGGYIFVMNGGPISWRSKLQPTQAFSTAEAEYVAAAHAGREAEFLNQIAKFCGLGQKSTIVLEDNQSCIKMARNPVHHGRTKSINIAMHYLRDQVRSGRIQLLFVPTTEQAADFLTKGVGVKQHQRNLDKVLSSVPQAAGMTDVD